MKYCSKCSATLNLLSNYGTEEVPLCFDCNEKEPIIPKGSFKMSGRIICRECCGVGYSRTITNGSIWIEVILWLCFIIPGLIYSVWRLTTRHKACKYCGSERIIDVNSPIGQKLMAEYHQGVQL